MKAAPPPPERIADDLIHGAQGFADELGIPLRRAVYLLETGQIPAAKMNSRWIGFRSKLRQHLEKLLEQERGAA